MKGLVIVRLLAGILAPVAAAWAGPLSSTTQLIVVTADGWGASIGRLERYERLQEGTPWRLVGRPTPVVIGRAGLGWGAGLPLAVLDGPKKVEGDNRSPAGIFRLGRAFGFSRAEAESYRLRVPFLDLTPATECVDDPASNQYNRIVERTGTASWKSSEKMREIGEYRWGLVVEHNSDPPAPGRGSCIFLHVSAMEAGSATSGCTAMQEDALLEVLRWLDPDRKPVLVQVPAEAYPSLRAADGAGLTLPERP